MSTAPSAARLWFKRLAAAGFLFFLVKGLVWLAIIGGAVVIGTRG